MNIIMSRALQQYHNLHGGGEGGGGGGGAGGIPSPISGIGAASTTTTPTSPLDFTAEIPFSEIRMSSETLGSGSFGTVFKGYWRGRSVAVKQFRTREEIDSFLVEVKQLSCVKHPNIVTLFGASVQSQPGYETAYLVMEYAEGGSLNHLLHECKQQPYDLRHACTWALQTARGVTYLHEMRPKPIMHRDLKPANLLLFSRGKTLKICDFGTACTVKTQMTNNTGSASYMAPEVFATNSYLVSGDVYSWSIIFWEILARQHPYSQQFSNAWQILWQVNQVGTRPNKLENCPKLIWDLITRSWDKDPKRRPSMRQVMMEMEFISRFTSQAPSASTQVPTSNTNSQQTAGGENLHQHLFPNHHHYHQQHYQQSDRGLSSAGTAAVDDDYRPLPYQNNYPHAYAPHPPPFLPHPVFDRSPSIQLHKRRELGHHCTALIDRLEKLKKHAKELELSTESEEIQPPYRVIDEIKKLADEEREKREELKQRRLRISNLVKNFDDIYLKSAAGTEGSDAMDCSNQHQQSQMH